jgi:prevent-host-death family protein
LADSDRLNECYACSTIVEVATRELRNDTAGVLRRVEGGETVVITVRGKPVADLVPHRPGGPRWVGPEEVMEIVTRYSADPGLRDDLERIAGDTTDDLGPIR